ncbi:response regulator transcription factor [Staphylococcus sp. 17KM0847]|uniref:helix-turn-helix transcriptional regulator n=1 Tax=Staphylococcus sp. 17KM0847 TaxID=2583989 RepID=UPI0015DC2F28|nr:response regulator transcription factor [Staphylococcus sp. 17KM0847]QLK86792.1 helix-turn-helix domain-containing protein [Staphylococcus sp. 17KM0847]
MFPKIYYLTEPMTHPVRCFDSIILVLSLDGSISIKKEGQLYSDVQLHLINESELYEIHSDSALLFYIPSSYFKKENINIFNATFVIQQHDAIKANLALLFNYFKTHEHTSDHAKHLVTHLLKEITRHQLPPTDKTNDMLEGIVTYIREHLQERITLETLSKNFYVSSSYISILFKQQMNMNFYEYLTSLRVAKSMEDVSMHDKKVKTIAHLWHYPSATNYIIHFKKYIGMTPKKYKTLPANARSLSLPNITSDHDILNRIEIETTEKERDVTVFIDDTAINEAAFSYFNLVDIGSYENIDMIINEPIFLYKNFSNYKLSSYIYISEPIENAIKDQAQEALIKIRKLLKTKISIALKITDIKSYYFIIKAIEDLHFLESEHSSVPAISGGKVLLLLDLKQLAIKDIQRIKKQVYDIQISTALDITDDYIASHPIDEQVHSLHTDFYTIDFKKIRNHYRNAKIHIPFKAMQSSLYQFLDQNTQSNQMIFLNYNDFYTPEILSNMGLFLKESLEGQPYLAGATIDFTQPPSSTYDIAIFDSIENKTPFFFLGIMLLNFSKYPCCYGEHHIITRSLHSYNILLYNTEHYARNFYITLSDHAVSSQVLLSTETLNNKYGDVDSMIDKRITDKSHFPNSLKYKLSQYNSPHLNVDQHDFSEGPYVTHVPPMSVAMITIYQ